METPKTVKSKEIPSLQKMQSTYKMIIPEEVERKIRYLQAKFPSTEWSGVLFIKYSGSFENKNLEITCVDIFPMDLGNSTYTNFFMSPDVASYMAQNDLFECDLALVHSHHQMATFFSSTDLSTLQSEGCERNCFVSLIVNNAGTYSAAITRHVKSKHEVTIKNIATSYEFFGEGAIEKPTLKSETKVVEKDEIQYFMLDIEKPTIDNPYLDIDKRFEKIQTIKEQSKPKVLQHSNDFDWDSIASNKKFEDKELPIWDREEHPELYKEEDNSIDYSIGIDQQQIDEALVHMLSCSLLNDAGKFNLDGWIKIYMKNLYDKRFGSAKSDAFEQWVSFIVEESIYSLHTEGGNPMEDDDIACIAQLLKDGVEALNKKYPNEYLDRYISELDTWIY